MRIHILSIGKYKSSYERDWCNDYIKRLPWKVVIHELEIKHHSDMQKQKRMESEMLLDKCPKSSFVVALDGTGKTFSSEELAKKIEHVQLQGHGDITFLIGGAWGHDASVLTRADMILSLGKMTWPHVMARVMLMEQIYRSYTLLHNHPYHK